MVRKSRTPHSNSGCPRRFKHVIWKEVKGKGVLLDLETGAYFETDPVGLSIWKECDGRKTIDMINRKIAVKFSASPERTRKDIIAYLKMLRKKSLLAGESVRQKSRNVITKKR